MTDARSLGEKLAEMAEDLIVEVTGSSVEVKVTAFKALSAFWIAATKLEPDKPDEGDAPGTFGAMRAAVKAAEGGK